MKFSCSFCNKAFKSLSALNNHQSAKNHLTTNLSVFDCNLCLETFDTLYEKTFHQKYFHSVCASCNFFSESETETKRHLQFTGHTAKFECGICVKTFVNENTYAAHLASKSHIRKNEISCCFNCDKGFFDLADFAQHLQSSGHSARFRCNFCYRCFISKSGLASHQKGKGHTNEVQLGLQAIRSQQASTHIPVTEFRCLDCDRGFRSQKALNDHLRNTIVHKPKNSRSSNAVAESSKPTCYECNKQFKNQAALNNHLSSVVHKPISNNLKCVGKNGCNKSFSSPSAMIMHLESGTCRSKISRKEIDALIAKHDTGGMITTGNYVAQNLIGFDDTESVASSSSSDSGIWTPYSDNESNTISNIHEYTFLARPSTNTSASGGYSSTPTGSTWSPSLTSSTGALTPLSGSTIVGLSNRHPLRCPKCPQDRKPFKTFESLRTHLDSLVHAPKLYHCPDFLLPSQSLTGKPHTHKKEFASLSGLTQHLESGACAGGKATFEKAINFVSGRLAEMGLGDTRLIG